MSLGEPTSDSAPFFSDDSEAEGPEEQGGAVAQRPQEEPASGVSSIRALLTVFILCYINLLNYMDRFTVAGVLPDIEQYFGINDEKSGLLQTGDSRGLKHYVFKLSDRPYVRTSIWTDGQTDILFL